MLNSFHKLLIGGFSSLIMTTVIAATPISTVTIPIEEGKQPEQVAPLLSQALNTVFIRMTGNPEVSNQAAIVELLKDPNSFLENYHQQASDLKIAFNQTNIEQALQKAGIAYWQQKPTIMTWWLDSDTTTSNIIGDSQADADSLQLTAAEQGFLIRLPLADLAEQALADKINFDTAKPTVLLQVSEQYTANAVLIVYNQHIQDKYQAKWQLWLISDKQKPLTQGQVETTTKTQLAEQIFANTNYALAKIFITKATKTEPLEIVISGVDFSRYVTVNNLMANFGAQLVETSGSTIRYKVNADPSQLKAQLSLIHILQTTTDVDKVNKAVLNFHVENNQ